MRSLEGDLARFWVLRQEDATHAALPPLARDAVAAELLRQVIEGMAGLRDRCKGQAPAYRARWAVSRGKVAPG